MTSTSERKLFNVLTNSLKSQRIDDENNVFGSDDDLNIERNWTTSAALPTRDFVENRNWFCCTHERRPNAEQPTFRSRPLSCRYSVIRSEPKSQSEIVCATLYSLTENNRNKNERKKK